MAILLFSIFFLIRKIIVRKIKTRRAILIIFLISILTYLYSRLEIIQEKIHIFEYALLGWLVMKDFFKNKNKLFFNLILLSIIFCAVISLLDEGFQKILPYRVFDYKDLVINDISSSIGIFLFTIFYYEKNN